jgi:hypothetical protein
MVKLILNLLVSCTLIVMNPSSASSSMRRVPAIALDDLLCFGEAATGRVFFWLRVWGGWWVAAPPPVLVLIYVHVWSSHHGSFYTVD